MSRTMEAVKLFQAAENALMGWNLREANKNDTIGDCDQTELAEAIVNGWDRMPTAKTPQAHLDGIFKAVVEVLKMKAELNPTNQTLPRGKGIEWVARMTIKNYWG